MFYYILIRCRLFEIVHTDSLLNTEFHVRKRGASCHYPITHGMYSDPGSVSFIQAVFLELHTNTRNTVHALSDEHVFCAV